MTQFVTYDELSLKSFDDGLFLFEEVFGSDLMDLKVFGKLESRTTDFRQQLRRGKKHRIIHLKYTKLLHLSVQFIRCIIDGKVLFGDNAALMTSQK